MSFLRGLLTARSHLSFLLGLAFALAVAFYIERTLPRDIQSGVEDIPAILDLANSDRMALREHGVALTAEELKWAEMAWLYFQNNYQAETGFVNSVDKFPSTTLWDLGSYAMGLLAAHDLALIPEEEYRARLVKMLESLAALSLVDGKLPNKAYRTSSLQMVDYGNNDAPKGIGWSVIDVARMAIPLTIIVWQEPELAPQVRALLSSWNLGAASNDGRLQGAEVLPDGNLRLVAEGRFGYEQYAAKSMFLLGVDVDKSIRYDLGISVQEVSGQLIAYDRRLPRNYEGTHNAVLSEPYVLEAIEYGLTENTRALAESVYRAQLNRFNETGILTAVSEDNIDRKPYFVYNSVLNDRKPWAAFAPDNSDASAHRTLSVKAAIGWAYLFDVDYRSRLIAGIRSLNDPERGWYSGRYEGDQSPNKAITANTNGIILEVLWYRVRGPLLRYASSVDPGGSS